MLCGTFLATVISSPGKIIAYAISRHFLQGRFAESLALCINSRLSPLEQQQQLEEQQARAAAEMDAGLAPVYDEAAVINWVESLTDDPCMAALLEPIVANDPDVRPEPVS